MIDNLLFIDAQELLMTPVNKPQFLVDDLIPSGVSIIAGDEKAGKSWMMLHLALCVAQGKDFLSHHVNQGTVAGSRTGCSSWRMKCLLGSSISLPNVLHLQTV